MRDEVGRHLPVTWTGYDRFMAESEAIYRIGFEQLGHVPFGSPMDMLRIAAGPDEAGRLAHRAPACGRAREGPASIRMALSFHPLFIGGNPFKVTAIYSMIAYLEREFGVHARWAAPMRIVSGMAKLIRGQGGSPALQREVDEITCTGRQATGVRLAGGEVVPADIVVSNADTAQTYRRLLKSSAAQALDRPPSMAKRPLIP